MIHFEPLPGVECDKARFECRVDVDACPEFLADVGLLFNSGMDMIAFSDKYHDQRQLDTDFDTLMYYVIMCHDVAMATEEKAKKDQHADGIDEGGQDEARDDDEMVLDDTPTAPSAFPTPARTRVSYEETVAGVEPSTATADPFGLHANTWKDLPTWDCLRVAPNSPSTWISGGVKVVGETINAAQMRQAQFSNRFAYRLHAKMTSRGSINDCTQNLLQEADGVPDDLDYTSVPAILQWLQASETYEPAMLFYRAFRRSQSDYFRAKAQRECADEQ